ncbi:polysaccharide deacetylase family protein [Peterkaempfera bronchialis]|uniref:polysaccharide deacetylase family protein n=1 Tax=Peterkaempfera bronchialis TaxID=2126346 RepID=UPI003C2B86EB
MHAHATGWFRAVRGPCLVPEGGDVNTIDSRPVSVCLTFDHMGGGQEVGQGRRSHPDPDRQDLAVAFPRILELLDLRGVPATFYIEGWSALHHPDALDALLTRGHDLGLHGWVHERWARLPRAERRRILHDGTAALRLAGCARPGFRAPGGLLAPGDLELFAEVGITEDSSILPAGVGAAHAPTVHPGGVVNVPFGWPAVDYWQYVLNEESPATPDTLVERWLGLLDQARERPDRLLVLVAHPGASGLEDDRFEALRRVVETLSAAPDVEFVTVATAAARARAAAGAAEPEPWQPPVGPRWVASRDLPAPPPPVGADAEAWVPYLHARGLTPAGPERAALCGGVSADVVRVGDLVVKRPKRKLDVPFDWQAGTGRILAEAAALRMAGPLAPAPLHVDERHHVLVQPYVHGRPWKQELLQGRVDPEVVCRVAEVLPAVRAMPVRGLDGHERFHRLRLMPYFLATAQAEPRLRPAMTEIVDRLSAVRTHLVHGDLSPKNILVGRTGAEAAEAAETAEAAEPDRVGAAGAVTVTVLDWEVVHVGDPTFDQAFLLSHLLAKASHLPELSEQLRAAAATVRRSCPETDDAWLARLLGALLLARVYGRSQLEYLDARSRERVARQGRALLTESEELPW